MAKRIDIRLTVFRFFITLALGCCFIIQTPRVGSCKEGYWSAESVDLQYSVSTVSARATRDIDVISPDKKKRVIVTGVGFHIKINGKRLPDPKEDIHGIQILAELGWSPDSKAFFVTQSDGGEVGTWYVNIYILGPRFLIDADITNEVKKDFMARYNCDVWGEDRGNEIPNIAAIKWLNGSSKLLLLAEVPPHSSCPEMGKFMGYVVSVPSGKILVRYSAAEVKAKWGRSLGRRHSNDEKYDIDKGKLPSWK